MATDTKDAPSKAPSKGFSLRSRLLGIPPEGKAEPANEEPIAPTESPDVTAQTEVQQASIVAPAEPEPSKDDDDEGEVPPRVGVALAPRRSLLASVFGRTDKKPQVEAIAGPAATAPEEAVESADETAKTDSDREPATSAVEASTENGEHAAAPDIADTAIVETPVVEVPVDAPRERRFSFFKSAKKATASKDENFAPPVADSNLEDRAAELPVESATPTSVESASVAEEAPAAPEAEHSVAPFVRFSGVTKTYDGINLIVKGLDLDIARGEFLTLLGPSGSGKTTTLMMLAGFEQPTAGDILLNGVSMTEQPPHKRGLGFVFQNYALFPHMSVAENVAFPLEVRRIRNSEIKERVAKALSMVELSGFDKRKPHQLSGGQQQRVAMARALVFSPDLVLMDEPLGALDKHLREQMQYELKRLHRELGVTVVYVTHDQGEALTLSDRIAVFHDGIIQQLDTPTRIYNEPSNAFVAGFIGENNALPGKIMAIRGEECLIELIGGTRVRALNGNCEQTGQEGVVCIRPENLTISAETSPGSNHVAALIDDFIFHGDHVRVKLSAPGMSEIIVKTPARGVSLPAKGVAVTLCWEPQSARAFVS